MYAPNCCSSEFVDIVKLSNKQSNVLKAWGLGPTLGPQKLFSFSWQNMHSPSFPGTF